MQTLLEKLIISSKGKLDKRYAEPTPTKEEYIYKLAIQYYKKDTENPSQEL